MKPLTTHKKHSGRPSEFSPEVGRVICSAVVEGAPLNVAAERARVTHRTLLNWSKKFPEFRATLADAEEKAVIQLEACFAAIRGEWPEAARNVGNRLKEIRKRRSTCWS